MFGGASREDDEPSSKVTKNALTVILISVAHDNNVLNTGWGIKISHFSKGNCEGCSGGREVGVVSCSWLASTVVSTHNGLDR